ncbi:hypothetical protein AT746_03590 [Lacimicrobium alkaliphilum]|uniref:DUF3429 domain-containing protein n=2 Tax=Lacimicrobium alkaliphilum TaxID=1526571 RepID=A0A0U3AGY6_9ALTE|nr:hypothetical protein AT746_03590 [Lacimicrobium alkaliphilum]
MMRILGYAGSIPFLLLPLFYWQQWWLSELRISVLFQLYSCLILGFMAGVLWPVLYKSDQPTRRAGWVVSFVVMSFLAFALLTGSALLIQAVLFLSLRLYEVCAGLDQAYPCGYVSLRSQLTAVVILCHLWMYWLI